MSEPRRPQTPPPEIGSQGPPLQRPEPTVRWTERFQRRVDLVRERGRTRRELSGRVDRDGNAGRDESVGQDWSEPIGRARDGSLLFAGLIAVVSAVLALGAFWGWQTWSDRSAEPIDDLLPVLVGAVPEPSDRQGEPSEQDETRRQGEVSLSPPAQPESGVEAAPVDSASGSPRAEPERSVAVPAGPTPTVVIVVHVSGAVTEPGVVHLTANSRVFEAVELAGGATAVADLDRVNLAAPLVDGERIHVPAMGEESAPVLIPSQRPQPTSSPFSAGVSGPTVTPTPPIADLNIATQRDFEQLPGIGPATAQAIVRTREARGPFFSVDELLEVPGIGEVRLEQLRPYIVVIDPRWPTGQ